MREYDPNHLPEKSYFLLGVKVILLNEHNQILLLERSSKLSRPNGWDFPGGGVDSGETFEDACIREVLEETNLKLTNLEPLGSFHTHSGADEAVLFVFSAKLNGGAITLSWEHESYKWLSTEEIEHIELPDLHRRFIDIYKNKKDS